MADDTTEYVDGKCIATQFASHSSQFSLKRLDALFETLFAFRARVIYYLWWSFL